MNGTLYLIPSTLGTSNVDMVLAPAVRQITTRIKHYIVEELRTARRWLKLVNRDIQIDEIQFYVLNEHTKPEEYCSFLNVISEGHDVAILSEAGVPCVADPGTVIVRMAQEDKIKVVPLPGPSSIIMALMASGLNGQNFAFSGYLPVKGPERRERIESLEKRSTIEGQSQFFIEAPYRSQNMLEDILETCFPSTLVCIACDISLDTEMILTKTVTEWRHKKPDLNKKPVVFGIQSGYEHSKGKNKS